jgi:hypothetical protein
MRFGLWTSAVYADPTSIRGQRSPDLVDGVCRQRKASLPVTRTRGPAICRERTRLPGSAAGMVRGTRVDGGAAVQGSAWTAATPAARHARSCPAHHCPSGEPTDCAATSPLEGRRSQARRAPLGVHRARAGSRLGSARQSGVRADPRGPGRGGLNSTGEGARVECDRIGILSRSERI